MEKEKFGHLMIDIETMSTESNAAIISIGAVEFNMSTGEIGKEYYTNVSLKSCMEIGLELSSDTIMWWLGQSDEARKSLCAENPITINDALNDLDIFITDCGGKNCEVWGNSARFDLGILSDAYKKINIKIPWDFRRERCVRTLVSFLPEIKNMAKNNGVAHNALSDCYFQIKYCSEIWNTLKNNR